MSVEDDIVSIVTKRGETRSVPIADVLASKVFPVT
jgi:hypothetical protein